MASNKREHIIDKNGDTLILLEKPNEENEEITISHAGSPLKIDPESSPPSEADLLGTSSPWINRYTPTHYRSLFAAGKSAAEVNLPGKGPEVLAFRASSQRLIESSKYFQCMLKGPWVESTPQTGVKQAYQIKLVGHDEEALVILLSLMHSAADNRSMPWTLRSSTHPRYVDQTHHGYGRFVQLATLVDYFNCTPSLCQHVWDELMAEVPERPPWNSLGRIQDLALLLELAWTMRRAEKFSQITTALVQESRGLISASGLLVPGVVFERIEAGRKKKLAACLSAIESLSICASCHSYCYGCKNFPCSIDIDGKTRKVLKRVSSFQEDTISNLKEAYMTSVVAVCGAQIAKSECIWHSPTVRPRVCHRAGPGSDCTILTQSRRLVVIEFERSYEELELGSFISESK